jgi:hypothetical protein
MTRLSSEEVRSPFMRRALPWITVVFLLVGIVVALAEISARKVDEPATAIASPSSSIAVTTPRPVFTPFPTPAATVEIPVATAKAAQATLAPVTPAPTIAAPTPTALPTPTVLAAGPSATTAGATASTGGGALSGSLLVFAAAAALQLLSRVRRA